ncbi:PEP/pyruvate-binding domain-containing protein [Streptomyces sp. NRRL F-5135]|uniref:PEP/pyruvate-binding domain-containing protein n=1 Tax=Streptomyces sp. NRRL F-5135 TaxID=1463858 RepID=UPI0007C44140|nr:PEP/pyruvate-binding domain-containing protein [Streptomyces sp. NRRL F-5135]
MSEVHEAGTASAADGRTPLVVALDRAGTGMLPLVGGKAVNLGVMTAAGLRVPDGVCVTTEAYRQVTREARFAVLAEKLSAVPPGDTVALSELAGEIRDAVLGAPVPRAVTEALTAAYRGLGSDVPVAVRSSATAEDLPSASFAGQQDTYLNVVGEDAVLDAVRHCWASLWTDRAVAYRATNGIDNRSVRLAVVVQRMAGARAAGVMFTADPVSGRRHWVTVDAAPGLGEAVVSGAVNPDHFVVDTTEDRVVERRLGDKRLAVRPLSGGGTEHVEPTDPDTAAHACLDTGELRRLVALGRDVERLFGGPQDVEWTLDTEGRFWLTQSRPVTTLYPLPVTNARGDEEIRAYFCYSMVWQGIQGPVTPVGLSALRLVASGMARLAGLRVPDPYDGPAAYAESGGRMFLDITTAVRGAGGRTALPSLLKMVDHQTAELVGELFDDPRFAVTDPSRAGLVRRLGRIALRAGVPLRVAEAVIRPAAARDRAARVGARQAERFVLPETAGAGQRLDTVRRILLEGIPALFPRMVPIPAVGGAALGIALKRLGEEVTEEEGLALLRGLPHNVTTEMDLELWRLAVRIREEPGTVRLLGDHSHDELLRSYREGTLPSALQRGLTAFLDRFGHRAVAEIDLGAPRWADAPQHLFGVLAGYLSSPAGAASPESQFADGAKQAERTAGELVARARAHGRLSAAVVGFGIRRARQLLGLREITKFYSVLLVARARRELLLVGEHLVAAGRLDAVEDVCFLDLREVGEALAGTVVRDRIERRREEYVREGRRRHVPRMLLSDGTEPALAAGEDGTLRGAPASPGSVTGPVRLVYDPVGVSLRPGEILVAPSTDPGWTPLFLTAGGVVLETGGVNSHGAVVAREYGIPAVVGVPGVLSALSEGQTVTVNGTAGSVSAEERQSPEPVAPGGSAASAVPAGRTAEGRGRDV